MTNTRHVPAPAQAREAVAIPAGKVGYMIATAARAPSVHNTQPWRFKVGQDAIELYADPRRKLKVDPAGREMIISCGAALFGLRLAMRSLGYQPVVEALPDPRRLRLLARVTLTAGPPPTKAERRMAQAVPHRHTHRGPFAAGPLPDGLLAGLQHDALAEGATLAIVEPTITYQQLADIVSAASRKRDLDPIARAEIRRWSRAAGSVARDGVPGPCDPGPCDPGPCGPGPCGPGSAGPGGPPARTAAPARLRPGA